ncbi:MAG: hypothetical protein K9W44_08350 [Candidatus Lokiarchaeota archaeon]|nr:hypothetical protein [Candidatus Harpocratesius repetitus]
MARKNLSTSKSRKNGKKQRNNPKYHPKRKSKTTFHSPEGHMGFENLYDSEGFIPEFNKDLGYFDDDPTIVPEKVISYEEKMRLEKIKLLHQKKKAMAKEKGKGKSRSVDIKQVELDF